MAYYGNQNYTTFSGLNTKGSTSIRLQAGAASGTLRAELSENADRAWTLPNKSGTMPISGTFSVQVPVIVAGDFARTAIAVTGIRVEDGLMCTIQGDPLLHNGDIVNPAQLIAAKAGNGSISLTFGSLGGTTTAYQDMVIAYTAVR